MLTRKAILVVPFMAILSVSDIILEDGVDHAASPEILEKRIKVRAFYAKVVLNFCVTFIGAYLSLAQLAKNHKVYNSKTDTVAQKNYLDKLFISEPFAVLKLIIFGACVGLCFADNMGAFVFYF